MRTMRNHVVALMLGGGAVALAQNDRAAILEEELPKLKTVYRATPLKPLGRETPLAREYYGLLNRYVRYVQPNLRDWPAEPGARFHKRDGSKELDVRQNATVALAFALLGRHGDFDERAAGASRKRVHTDALALLRYLAITHLANFLPTGDGKPWGNHWQSAFWAGIAGQAAWLVWDDLPDETKVMAARMIIHEANRFNARPPDSGHLRDSKAEENAWNSEVIALACCLFPQHPHAALWRERAILYMINSFTTPADREDPRVVDGKRVKDWVTTTTIHPDFTLENHNRVHPDYLSTFSLNLRNAILFRLAGQEIPQATFHHARDCFGVLQHLTATNGSLFYVNGQDWWPHRHDVPLMAGGFVGPMLRDASAAAIERMALDWLKRMHARFDDGRAFDPREYNYANLEEEMMARYAELYLAHRLFGDGPRPVSPRKFQAAQCGTRIFDAGGFVTHRTPEKFVSFAWRNGAMGLVYPAGDTWFTAPHESGLVGRILLRGAKDTPPRLEAKNVFPLRLGGKADDGFGFVGRFTRCEGKVEQRVAMLSLPDGPVVYAEQLRALADVHVDEIATGIIGILNEDARPMVPNERRVWTAEGQSVLRGAADAPASRHVWKTTWANLDGRLGLIANASGRMACLEEHTYKRARLQQELIANYLPEAGLSRKDEIICHAVVALLPNARPAEPGVLKTEHFGEAGVAVLLERWLVAANLSEKEVAGGAFGVDLKLAPLGATCLRAPHRPAAPRSR